MDDYVERLVVSVANQKGIKDSDVIEAVVSILGVFENNIRIQELPTLIELVCCLHQRDMASGIDIGERKLDG